VVLAGWMRILTNRVLQRFAVVNIHPALPGQFPGIGAIERSFAAWQAGEITESGAMVHWVPDEGVDNGPVIAERVVPFEPGDTQATFEERLHRVEHTLYVEAIASLLPTLQQAGSS